jgi:hypothetical protein
MDEQGRDRRFGPRWGAALSFRSGPSGAAGASQVTPPCSSAMQLTQQANVHNPQREKR